MTRRRAAEQLPRLPFVSTPVLTEEKNGELGSPHEQISLAKQVAEWEIKAPAGAGAEGFSEQRVPTPMS